MAAPEVYYVLSITKIICYAGMREILIFTKIYLNLLELLEFTRVDSGGKPMVWTRSGVVEKKFTKISKLAVNYNTFDGHGLWLISLSGIATLQTSRCAFNMTL